MPPAPLHLVTPSSPMHRVAHLSGSNPNGAKELSHLIQEG